MSFSEPNFDNCMCTETRVGRVAFPANDVYLYRALAECGDYCYGEMHVYERLIKPGMTVLDVGANIGLMSLLMSGLVGEAGCVHAFEPSKFANGLLRHNAELNGCQNLNVHRAAMSDAVGTTDFASPDPASITSFNYGVLSLGNSIDARAGDNVPTDMITIDSLGLDDCGFIKIDVEGFESAVIRGALRTIDQCQPCISLEIGNPDDDISWVSALRGRGYRIFAIKAFIYSWPNFKARKIDDLPNAVCVSAIAVPPGINQMEVFGSIYRQEILDEENLASINADFTKDVPGV